MKARLLILSIMFTFLFAGFGNAQKKEKNPTVFIKTNTQCNDCKERVERLLNFEKGVIYAELHVDKKEIEVKFNSKRISLEKIKQKITELGYAADELEPIQEAQSKLPACCQPGGHD